MTEAMRILHGADAPLALHPLRRRLLGALQSPDSATGLARRLSLPRQKINYHLRELESAGLVELVEERPRRGFTERVVRAAARAYLVDPSVLAPLGADPASPQDRFSSTYQVAAAARCVSDLAALRERAKRAGKSLATLTIEAEVRFRSAAARAAFAQELADALAALVSKYHDADAPGGREFRLLSAVRPALKPESTEESATRRNDP